LREACLAVLKVGEEGRWPVVISLGSNERACTFCANPQVGGNASRFS